MKRKIRLTEADLHRIVNKSVNTILNEMAYQRKTKDEWAILGNYGYGWDVECYCDDYQDAKATLKAYRENCRDAMFKLKLVRTKIEN